MAGLPFGIPHPPGILIPSGRFIPLEKGIPSGISNPEGVDPGRVMNPNPPYSGLRPLAFSQDQACDIRLLEVP